MNVSLPDTLKEYVEEQVSSGGYGTSNEYLRELIRGNKKRNTRYWLKAMLLEGLESGDPVR